MTEDGAPAFFKAQHGAFLETLAARKGMREMVPALIGQACSSFEGNVGIQVMDQPGIACCKGCATCCTIRVIATAPEVLMVARYVRAFDASLKQAGIDLEKRIGEADSVTRSRDGRERVTLRRCCPFIAEGICVIYPVRPLACRGHASHDRQACFEAASGRLESIPFSMPHMMVRSLVQNAMQSALRDIGLAWTAYELNHALSIALADDRSEEDWMTGADIFADAMASEIDPEEMASVFDRIHGRKGQA